MVRVLLQDNKKSGISTQLIHKAETNSKELRLLPEQQN